MKFNSVTFFHENWQLGGVERTNIQWTKILKNEGLNVQLINLNSKGAVSEVFDRVIEVSDKKEEIKNSLEILSPGDALIICQPYLLKKIFTFIPFLLKKKIRIILAIRNSMDQFNEKIIRKIAASVFLVLLAPFLYRIIVNSHELTKEFPFSLTPNCVPVINPRFDVLENRFTKEEFNEPPKKIIFVGRWAKQKGIEFLDEIDAICRENGFTFEAYCNESNKPYQNKYIQDIISFYSSNNVALIFCSLFEGYPNILVEARAMGVPILYSHCKSGTREILSGYKAGIEFNKNRLQTLHQALNTLKETNGQPIDNEFIKKHLLQNSKLIEALG